MPYCLYVRKSRSDAEAEMRGEGETLARHIQTLTELAQRRGLPLEKIHREIVSGETIAARPVMQTLLSEVAQGLWEGVLVMEIERLARGDTIDQGIVAQTFLLSGTKIITPLKDFDPCNEFDEEYFEFGLFMSRREYKTINRRMQRGRLASVKEGNYVGSLPPYGYERVKNPLGKGYTLRPMEPEADVVRLIFRLYTQGDTSVSGARCFGISRIARRLDDWGISPRKSCRWSPATVRDILINPIYIGKVRWNWRPTAKTMRNGRPTVRRPRSKKEQIVLSNGTHPPLIDEETFLAAQIRMQGRTTAPVSGERALKNPLAGLVICEKCGRKMIRRPHSSQSPDTLLCPNAACGNGSIALPLIEQAVVCFLERWFAKYPIPKDIETPSDDASPICTAELAFSHLRKEARTLKRQLERTYDLLEQGIYTAEEYKKRLEKLKERKKKNEEKQATLRQEAGKDTFCAHTHPQIPQRADSLAALYSLLPTPKAKNDFLKGLLEKITYQKESRGTKKTPASFTLTIYPKLPAYPRGE